MQNMSSEEEWWNGRTWRGWPQGLIGNSSLLEQYSYSVVYNICIEKKERASDQKMQVPKEKKKGAKMPSINILPPGQKHREPRTTRAAVLICPQWQNVSQMPLLSVPFLSHWLSFHPLWNSQNMCWCICKRHPYLWRSWGGKHSDKHQKCTVFCYRPNKCQIKINTSLKNVSSLLNT